MNRPTSITRPTALLLILIGFIVSLVGMIAATPTTAPQPTYHQVCVYGTYRVGPVIYHWECQ